MSATKSNLPAYSPGTERFFEALAKPVSARQITEHLSPPRHFANSTFESYETDPAYPGQALAKEQVRTFASSGRKRSHGLLDRLLNSKAKGEGIYLDGGFGVGKTHLLASAYHQFPGKKAFLSFLELMFLVGLEGLDTLIQDFRKFDLVAIDEFELDDPANTRIAFRILSSLFESGAKLLTSSNTPPGALGEGKFSRDDFERELGEIGRRFEVIRVDGEDYRFTHHLVDHAGESWITDASNIGAATTIELNEHTIALSERTIELGFSEFLSVLSSVHPMRIRTALPQFDLIALNGVTTIAHPHQALQFVYLIDKAYDNDVRFLVSADISIDEVFHPSYLRGGDTKKYLRALSRLRELTQPKVTLR